MHRAGLEGGGNGLAFGQGHLAGRGARDQGHEREAAVYHHAHQGALRGEGLDAAVQAVACAGGRRERTCPAGAG
jgi:hypothetical protein